MVSLTGKLNDWEKFELETIPFLEKIYHDLPVAFKREGGQNSTKSDICVLHDMNELFSLEAKLTPSQSGQFVLLEEQQKYIFSAENKFQNNKMTQLIIDELNAFKTKYTPKGQKAVIVDIDTYVLANWIKDHYKNKGSRFIITSTKINDYKAIIPINEVERFFEMTAVIRRKKSGTSDVARYKVSSCISELRQHLTAFGLEIIETKQDGKKTLVLLNKDIILEKNERYFGDEYFLSPNVKGNGYFIKSRAKTNNLNVIFQLKYIGPEKSFGFEHLERSIRKCLSIE
ncbi:hypothetical protein [Bacillus suaedae]|uniref:Uncharacterized protein n=1 Tax=Halalkalibacter suaedae TaxID=2822140 RepID=A0A940WZ09_9BACI|nr:hypothetical protein [Bacillus suaedae]MBP3953567.1 hypothetical protein [Bacillus suaedae]